LFDLGYVDENISPATLSYNGRSGIGVKLISTGAERTVGLLSNGSLFTVADTVTLTLDNNITLQGRSDNDDYASLVWVDSGGTLVMNIGAKITGNTNNSYGGGVYSYGTFRIITGTIYGSNANPVSLRNTATYGAALYKRGDATAQRGTFSGETWNSLGTLSTTENTIKVLNGQLVQ
jgi:hypothetical protein